jgi:uncharacterized membrane protein
MKAIYFDNIGLTHLVFAVLSIIAGSLVLYLPKGTRNHRQIGYVYAVCMIIILVSSLLIYRLFKGFGLFHVATLVSFFYLSMGMYAPLFNRKNKNWMLRHFTYMYWSVLGLYAAFVAEISARVPETPFFPMVGMGSMSVIVIGIIGWRNNKEKWRRNWVRE